MLGMLSFLRHNSMRQMHTVFLGGKAQPPRDRCSLRRNPREKQCEAGAKAKRIHWSRHPGS